MTLKSGLEVTQRSFNLVPIKSFVQFPIRSL